MTCERDLRVAVLAVDPSSPYSGGALLGDRIRMAAHTADPDVLVRQILSLAQTRLRTHPDLAWRAAEVASGRRDPYAAAELLTPVRQFTPGQQ
jgi:hypothetical protein